MYHKKPQHLVNTKNKHSSTKNTIIITRLCQSSWNINCTVLTYIIHGAYYFEKTHLQCAYITELPSLFSKKVAKGIQSHKHFNQVFNQLKNTTKMIKKYKKQAIIQKKKFNHPKILKWSVNSVHTTYIMIQARINLSNPIVMCT